jgi:tetratricopeptide (TPR) repeat protein
MKLKMTMLAAVLMLSAAGFAQKDEMKVLKKIYDKEKLSEKDLAEYKTNAAKLDAYMAGASEADRIYMNYFKVQVPSLEFNLQMQKAENQAQAPMLFMKAFNLNTLTEIARAYYDVLQYEKKSGKQQYTKEINQEFQSMSPMLSAYAGALDQQKNYKDVARLLYAMYLFNPSNQDMLYNAATYAVSAPDYGLALEYYNELKALNYSGEGTAYFAVNTATDSEESFATKAERDKMIAIKTHVKPREEKIQSKRGEIYKNIALIYLNNGKVDQAKKAIEEAKRENPDDSSLMLAEADLYLNLKDTETYKKIITQVLAKNPNDADLVYNLGVITMQNNELGEAEKYFKRAVEIDPKYVNAYINLTAIGLQGDQPIVDQMNKLGTSPADNKKYASLKAQREALFKSVLPFLERAYAVAPDNADVIDNYISVLGFLGQNDIPLYKTLKAKQKK